MLEARAICQTCGHTRDWHDRDAQRARLGSDPPVERACYREVGGAPCRCGGFRESGTFAMPAGFAPTRSSAPGLAIVRVAALAVLLVVMGLGLLYAYRSQTPSVPEVPVSVAIQHVNAGQIKSVTLIGNKATLEYKDSTKGKELTTLQEQDQLFTKALYDYNATHADGVIIDNKQNSQTLSVVGSIVLSLLPVLLIGLFFYYLLRRRRAS